MADFINRFDHNRRYADSQIQEVLEGGRGLMKARQLPWNFLSLGSEDGYILEVAVQLWQDAHYYGVEAESRVQACEPGELVVAAQECAQRLQVEFLGVDEERLFSELTAHPIADAADRKTLAHFYDGGVMPIAVMDDLCEQLAQVLAAGSVAVFVTKPAQKTFARP